MKEMKTLTVGEDTFEIVDEKAREITSKAKMLTSKNLFNVETLSEEGYWAHTETGVITAAVEYYCSDYIPVIGGEKYAYTGGYVTASTPNYLRSYCVYDENKNFINGVKRNTGSNDAIILTMPENAAFVIINFTIYSICKLFKR